MFDVYKRAIRLHIHIHIYVYDRVYKIASQSWRVISENCGNRLLVRPYDIPQLSSDIREFLCIHIINKIFIYIF